MVLKYVKVVMRKYVELVKTMQILVFSLVMPVAKHVISWEIV